MAKVRSGGVVILGAACLAMACNAITGAGDLEVTGLDDGGASSNGTSSGGPSKLDGQVGPFPGTSSSGLTSSSSGTSGALTCEGAGGACVAKAPLGWSGPYRVVETATTSTSKSCSPELSSDTFELGVGTPSGSFTCPACKCQSPSGGSCSSTISLWADTTCPAGAGPVASGDASSCAPNSTGAAVGAKFTHSVTSAGRCDAALNGAPQRGAISWTATYLYCGSNALSAIGCSSQDDRCLPPLPGAKVCIVKEGKDTCPAPYTAPTTIYGDVDDQRQCTAAGCTCATPAGVSCKGSYQSYSSSTCSAAIPTIPFVTQRSVDTCFTLEKEYSAKAGSPVTTQGGSCAAGGAATATGALLPANEGTTCCLP